MEGGCTRPPPDAGDLNRVQSHSGTSSQRCPVRTSQSSNSPRDSYSVRGCHCQVTQERGSLSTFLLRLVATLKVTAFQNNPFHL